jgi:glycosyltransferase involved in cell wall biosynthesis
LKKTSLTWAASRLRPAVTGGERYDLEVVEHWRRWGITVSEVEIAGLPRHDYLTCSLALRRSLLATGDRLLFMDFGPHNQFLLGALWHKMRGGKLATLVHHLSHPLKSSLMHQQIERALTKVFLQICDLVVVISHDTWQAVRELDIPNNRIGMSNPALGIFPPESLPSPHIPQKPWRLLYVGYFKHRKGLDLLLNVLEHLPRGDYVLTAVGDEEVDAGYASEMHRLVAERGLNVDFKGRLGAGELSRMYLTHDLLLHPARHEGFGMTLLEAQAHGLPVVAWATGGITEVVTNGKGGRLITPYDCAAFARAVLSLLTDAGEWQRQREFAIMRAQNLGGWEKPSATILSLLREHGLL